MFHWRAGRCDDGRVEATAGSRRSHQSRECRRWGRRGRLVCSVTSSSQREYQPLAGLPGWLTAKCDERFRGGITVNEHDVHVRKVFDITEPALIEHRHGYVFLGSGLVRESMTYWQLDSGPTPKAYRDYLAWHARPKAVLHLPEALSLRGRWENNFWHFHDNVLSKLIAGDELGLSPDIPLLVGKGLWDTRWFAEIKALPTLRDRNWVLHEHPVTIDRLIVCLEGSFLAENMLYAQQVLGTASDPCLPRGNLVNEMRRPPGGCRFLTPASRHRTSSRQRRPDRRSPRSARIRSP